MYEALRDIRNQIGSGAEQEFGNLEEDVSVGLNASKTGSVLVHARLNPRVADEIFIDFRFRTDPETVGSAVSALESQLRALNGSREN
jgi:hypothetical protein